MKRSFMVGFVALVMLFALGACGANPTPTQTVRPTVSNETKVSSTRVSETRVASRLPNLCGQDQQIALAPVTPSAGLIEYTPITTGGWIHSYVRALERAPDGSLLAGYSDGGNVQRLVDFSLEPCEGPKGKIVNAILVDALGRIWVVFDDPNIAASMYDGQQWYTYTESDGLQTNTSYAIFVDADGMAYLGNAKGVFTMPSPLADPTKKPQEIYQGDWLEAPEYLNPRVHSRAVHAFYIDPTTACIWVGYRDAGLSVKCPKEDWIHYTVEERPQVIGGNAVRTIRKSPNQQKVCVGVDVGDAYRKERPGITCFDQDSKATVHVLPSNMITNIGWDSRGRLWGVDWQHGVYYLEEQVWKPFAFFPTLSIVFGIGGENRVCIGTNGFGLRCGDIP